MVQVVMGHIIHHVTQQTSSKQSGSGRRSSHERYYVPKLHAENSSCCRRENKAKPIHRMLVMTTMKKIMHSVPPIALCLNVEKKAVKSVF
nr:hypothetical protein Iba_scaffold17097CG0170 [Ipomoea batatas]